MKNIILSLVILPGHNRLVPMMIIHLLYGALAVNKITKLDQQLSRVGGVKGGWE